MTVKQKMMVDILFGGTEYRTVIDASALSLIPVMLCLFCSASTRTDQWCIVVGHGGRNKFIEIDTTFFDPFIDKWRGETRSLASGTCFW